MSTHKEPIVLDKSFVQGSSNERLHALSEQYELLVTSSFYFEIFSDLESSHRKILYKLPTFQRIHTPAFLRRELETQQPVRSIPSKALTVSPRFISSRRALHADEVNLLKEFESKLVNPSIEFWKQVGTQGVAGFSEFEIRSTLSNEGKLIELCRRVLDTGFIRNIAEQCMMPTAHLFDETWFTFRMLQEKLLHGILLRYFYPAGTVMRSNLDLEHDVHDLDYLALALHSNNFATAESTKDIRKLGWRFKFLHPRGNLLSP